MSMLLHHGHGLSENFSKHLMPAGTDVDQPEPPKVLAEETHSHQPQQTYPGCYGLPYQDHNYGAPPPPTPPQSPPPTQAVARVPTPTPNHINGSTLDVEDGEPEVGKEKALESITDTINEVLNSVNIVEPSEPAVSHTIEEISADDDSVTRCICEYSHDDGYMICCDKCSVWQHIDCMGIDRNAIPDTYYCERCEPRPVDADKARDIQSRKREFLSDTSSSSETEIVTRYLDTSSGLNIIKKNGKKFRKKRKEKENDKLPKEEGETMGELPQVNIKPLLGQKKKKYKKFKKNKLKNENGVSLDKLEKVKKKLLKKQKENEQHIKKLKGSKLKAKKLKMSRMGMNDYQPSANLVATPLNHSEDANPAWDRMDTDSCKYVEALTNMYTADVMEVIASRKVNGTHPDSIEFRQQKDQLLARLGYVTQVRSATSIYRKGLKAAEDLTYNQAVVEYRGMFMLRQQFDKEKFFWQKGMPFVLFYGKLDGLDICVDASTFGNEARFVRRSCTPNAEVRHFLENGKLHLLIFSLKEITKGAEITIPFDFNYQECNYNVECACSRNNCPVHKFFKKLESKKENNKLNNVIVKPMKKKKSKSLDHIVSDRSEASCPSNIHVPSEESSAAGPAHCGKRKRVTPLQQSTNTNNINTVEEVTQTAPKQPPPPQPAPPPTNHDENSNIEIEVDGPSASTEAEADQEPEHHEPTPSEDEGTSHDSKKKTREERKMEAIMKAFEKLEKREERRKEALARLDHGQGKKDGKKGDDSEDDFKEDVKSVIPKSIKEHKDKVPEEVRVKVEKEDVKESPVKVKVEEPPPPPEVKVKEEGEKPKVEKPKHKGKKSKRSTLTPARRRSRVSSLCSSISENVVSQDESSNSTITSTPCTPLPSDPTINPFGQAFKFPKTKKHLMNEWLTEKGQDVNKPLSVKTDLEVPKDETMFVKYLPSPHTSLSHMRRNSTNTTPVASATVTTKTSTLGQSMGSAKKRWLRQAMFETDSDTSSSIPNGGSLSPNCTIPSPSQSPVIDFVTPLKKRRLAWRESQDGPYPPTPSTPSSEFVSPLDTPSSIINRSMSLDESKLRNGFNKVAFSPMTPVTPGVNLFEKISALSSKTEMPGYGKQESMESDVSESLLSPHRERRLTGESDSDSLLQPEVAPRHSVNNSVNSASSGAGLDDVASDVAMAEAEPSPSGGVDTVTTRANNVLVSNLSTTGCANTDMEKMEECDTSVETENTLRRRSLEVAESQGAEADTDNSKVEASGSSKHLNNDLSSVVEPTPSEPSVQNVLVDSQGELSNCDADAKCESSVEPMEVCSASVSSVTNSDEKIGGNADSTENQVGLSRPERVVTSEQTVSCSNGGLNRNSSESTGGMDSTEPTPGVSGVVTKKKEDDSVSSSGSSLEEGEICDSDEERHNEGKVSDSSQVPESQGFEYEVSESDARDIRTDNVVDTSTHQDTASTTNPDQSQPDQPNNSLQADSTSGIPDHKDGDTTNNITSSTVSDSDGALELNSQVSTTDSMDNSMVSGADTASSSQIASSSTNFISSSQASSLSTTTTTSADSSPSNSNIGSSYSPLAGSHLTTKPTGVASSTHSPIRSMSDQPSSTSGPSPPGSVAAASHSPIQQQKKKVSLLEYRKRMKEKSTGSSCNSASSTPTKTPTSVSFGSPRVTTPTVSLAPLPLFESSSPGDVDRSPFRDPADAKWSQPTSVERVREQSLAERLKREFGVDADDDDEEKKSECQARRRLPTTPPPPPPPSSVSNLSRGSLSAVAPHGVKMPLTDEASTSNADILKSVNPEILKAVAAVFKGAQISNKPRPSLGLPPGPQPVPPTSLAQAIAGANGTRSPAQSKLPSLMSLQTYTQGAQAQTQFNNYQTNGGPVPNQPFPQTPPIHQPPSFNQNQGPFPAGPAQAPGPAQTFSPATPPVKYPAQAPSFNQNQAFNGQPNASFPPASSTTQPGQDQAFQGQTFQPNFQQGQFGQNNFNQQQQFGPNTSQFGAPPQNGQMVPPTSSSGPPQGWQNYNNFNNQSQVPPPPPPQKNSSGYSKQKYPRKNSGGFSRDRSHHGHRD